MVISGLVEDIIYKNDDNNYTVMSVDVNGELVTAVGKIPNATPGVFVELTGTFSAHKKFGEQFNVTGVKFAKPNTKDGIIKYLSSGLIKGVGPITAYSIVEKFGESTLDVIEFNPNRLSEVRGISVKKAAEIAEAFSEIKKMQSAVMLMQSYSISTNMSVKIYNTYLGATEDILKENPYKLVEDVDGIGFFTADKIAMSMGIAPTSEFRFRAGILHCLKENCDKNGNTYVPKSNIVSDLTELLRLNAEDHLDTIEQVFKKLVLDSFIKEIQHEGTTIIMLVKYYNTEKVVASTLNLFNLYLPEVHVDVTDNIKMYETLNKIKMHEGQIEAVKTAINSGTCVITGGPGTGKTTIIKCILDVFRSLRKKVKLMAPTGRAAKRLSESTGTDASTIHRALEIDFTNANMFFYNNNNKLPYDVIIVDEVSMVDINLMHALVRAIKKGAQLILVGDKDQLPSVGAGNVLGDIIASGVVPVSYLTHIYRQSEDSFIITNAHAINNGIMPTLNNKSKDFFYEQKSETSEILKSVLDMTTTRIVKFLNIDSSKIQVLAPMKAGVCGVDNLNKCLQEKLNPPSLKKPEIETEKTIYRLFDRVMQITNNYERVWKKDGEDGTGVFNGDIGIVSAIDRNTGEVEVTFEDSRVVRYLRTDLGELVLSYAITIHKSQGSEFDCVILPITGGPAMLFTKNLLYTAVTRAKKMVVLIGEKVNIIRMVKNNYTVKRNTMLKTFLTQTKNELDAIDYESLKGE